MTPTDNMRETHVSRLSASQAPVRQDALRMLDPARLYVCTDARQSTGDFADFVDAAYRGGVDIIQLRDKSLDAGDELEVFAILSEAARRHGRLFAANDRADVAALAGADILHLGQRDITIDEARTFVEARVLFGQSTHARGQAAAARTGESDYYCIGPVWPTPTKPGRPAVGLEAVREVAADDDGSAPWFAIGGIDLDNVHEVAEAGARRICVVRAVTQAEDPEAAARALRGALPR